MMKMILRNALLTFLVVLSTVSNSTAQNEDSWWRKLFRRETVEEIGESQHKDTSDYELEKDLSAEDTLNYTPKIKPRGYISIVSPSPLQYLEKTRLEHPKNPKGFRIQIFFGNLQNAKMEKKNFMALHEDLECYLINNSPNFAVRIGDYRTELEAYKLFQELKEQYPFAYVVPDEIEFPDLTPQHTSE